MRNARATRHWGIALKNDLTAVDSHFEFGQNWSEFSRTIDERAIAEAERGLRKLFPNDELKGRHIFDLGCGSGLHALAALRLGATSVTAIDIDPKSVATARELLSRHAPHDGWQLAVQSVFAMSLQPLYDVVYSWGVLHHTGDMKRAIELAAAKVAPGGLLCVALYRKTKYCRMWQIEKRIYSHAPRAVRRLIERLFLVAFKRSYRRSERTFEECVTDYAKTRGMDFMTDIRDWLGGYPYDSISEEDMLALAHHLGLRTVRRFCETPGSGLFGTGCDEYVFLRPLH
jgi:2-polyprenyl-6-hydroxyphenyl methylase/3-demethylubiquinone-9 3-methyltransferase